VSVGALSLLFETAPGSVFDSRQLATLRQAKPIPAGWLVDLPLSGEVICAACGAPHRVEVAWDEVRQEMGRFCVDGGGWSAVDPSEIARVRVDHSHLLGSIAKAFAVRGGQEVLAPDICWRLGEAEIAGAGVALIAAREMNDPRRVMETARALHVHFKRGHGLILCGIRPLLDAGLMPRGFRAVAFEDVLAADDGGNIYSNAVAAALVLGLRRRRRGEHGVAVVHPKLAAYMEARLLNGQAYVSPSAEAQQLLADSLGWATPGEPLPSPDAVRMLVSRRQKAKA